MSDLPALSVQNLPGATDIGDKTRAPRLLLLQGSVRPGSTGKLLVEEAARIFEHLGGETLIFDPATLPFPEGPGDHPKAEELREALAWADAQFWCSPEYFGTLSSVMKAQLDWMVPVVKGEKILQGKPLAVAQVSGPGQSFNTSGTLATVGRWLGMIVTPSMLSVARAQEEFGADGRMKASPHYTALVDMTEELFKLAVALLPVRAALGDRYSARLAAAG